MGKKAFSPSALLTYGLALVMCIVAGCGVLGVFLPATGYHPGLSMQLPSVYTAAGHLLPSFLTPVHAVMVSPALATSVGKAVLIGTMATAFSLLLTFMMLAYLHRQMYAVQVILSPVLAMPHVAIAAGLVFLFSPSGWAARVTEALLGTATVSPLREMIQALWVSPDPWGITAILVLIIKETAFLLFVALAAVNRPQMKRQEQIALTLGYPASSVFWRVLAPELYAKLRLGVIAVLCYGVSQVEVNAVASTSLPPTLGVRVLQWYDDPDLLNQYVAAAAAALQVFVVACVVSAWIVAGKIVRIGHRFWSVSVPQLGRESHHVRHVPALMHLRPFRRVPHIRRHYRNLISRALRFVTETIPIWGSRVTFGVLVTLAVMSSVGMAIWSISGRWSYPSVAPTLYSAKYWQKAEIWLVAFNTLLIGVVAVVGALFIVISFLEIEANAKRRWHRWLAASFFVPLFFPPVSMVFGWQVFLLAVDWRAFPLVNVMLGHVFLVLPYVYLSVSTPWRRLPRAHRMAALTMGYAPYQVFWRIVVPQTRRLVLGGFAIGFAVSLAQYAPTLVLGRGEISTLTTEAVALASGGNRRVLGTFAVLQSVMPWMVFFIAFTLPVLLEYRRHRWAMRHA